MNPRSTVILLVVALGLGAFVYYHEILGGEERRESEAREKALFGDLEAESVEWVTLHTSDGRDVKLQREGEGWEVTEPLRFPADRFAADGVASALIAIASDTAFDEPQPAEVYGLADPSKEITFSAGGTEYGLRTGNDTPLGGGVYAAVVGEEPVYTVPMTSVNALRKSFDELRDKRILDFDAAAATRITATWPGGRVVLARSDGSWQLEAPVAGLADADTVNDLLSDLAFLRAVAFADEPPDAAATGLAAPAFAAEIELGDAGGEGEAGDTRRVSVAVGSVEDDGHLHVRAAQPSLYRIPAERLGDLPRELFAYRFKELARFGALQAQRVEVAFSAGGATSVVTATRGEAGWSSEPDAMEPATIQAMVDALSRLSASDVLAESVGPDELGGLALDPPNATFVVYGEAPADASDSGDAESGEDAAETPLAEVRVGAFQGNDGIVAQRADRPTLFRLDPSAAQSLPVSLEAFRARFVRQVEADPPPEADAGLGSGPEPEPTQPEPSPDAPPAE